MSFYANGVEILKIGFNTEEVNSVYFNNQLVWPIPYEWVGWDNATWEDIYKLCKEKQSGVIADWPSDVVLGATKSVSTKLGSTSTHTFNMVLVGIDIDGDGILTFISKTVCATTTNWSNQMYKATHYFNDSVCEATPYIKPLNKGYNGEYKECAVWVPSSSELGGASGAYEDNFTEGVSIPYPWMTDSANRIFTEGSLSNISLSNSKYNYIYLRSIDSIGESSSETTYHMLRRDTGTFSTTSGGYSYTTIYGFAIG